MKEYRKQPNIIRFDTPVIDLGFLNGEKVLIDELIPADKISNHNIVYNGNWFKKDENIFYFKVPITSSSFLKELLGVKVSEYFNLSSVQYKLAKATAIYNGEPQIFYGLVSKLAREKNNSYTTLEKIVKENCAYFKKSSNQYFAILDYLDQTYQDQPVTKEMRRFMIRDFYTQEKARMESEVLIENTDGKTKLGKLMDYEESWFESNIKDYHIKQYLYFDLEKEKCLSMVKKDEIIQEALIKMIDINIIELLDQVKEEHNIQLIPYDVEYYKSYSERIKRYVREKNLIR